MRLHQAAPLLLIAALLGIAGLSSTRPAWSDAEPDPNLRKPATWRLWHPRWEHLQLKPGWMVFRRTLHEAGVDPYPYLLAATEAQRARQEALPVTPSSLGTFVTATSLATEPGAWEAIELFLPAHIVPTGEAARRIRAQAQGLAPRLSGSALTKEGAHEVDGYSAPVLVRGPDGRMQARFLALATELELTLESVTGSVDPKRGSVTLERRVLIQGPPCARGLCGTGRTPEELAAEQARLVAERDLVRRTLRAALHPGRTQAAARALARAGSTIADIRSALGEPYDDIGSGLHIWVFALDQGVLLVGEAGRIHWMRLEPAHPHSPFPAEGESESLWPPP